MTQQIIDLGDGPDSNTGDSVYVAFTKTNENFTELYDIIGTTSGNLNANQLTANSIYTVGAIRSGNLNAFADITTTSNVVASGFFYPNGNPVVAASVNFGNITSNLTPNVDATISVGEPGLRFTSGYFSTNLVLAGTEISIVDGVVQVNSSPLNGVSNLTYNSENGNLTISTTSGSDYTVDIGTGRSDDPTFNSLTITTTATANTLVATSVANVAELQINGVGVIDSNGTIVSTALPDSGVSANTYGNASAVPVITVDEKGRVTNLSTAAVAGVSNVAYDTDSGNLTISTSAGSDFVVDIGTGRSDDPTFNSLTITTDANVGELKVNGTTVVDTGAEIVTAQLKDSGVAAGTYGNASAVPVITVDAKGRITVANTTAVAGVSNVTYDNATGNLTVSTSSGTDYVVDLGIGTQDSPTFDTVSAVAVNATTIGNSGATLTGELSTAAQPNVTSVGTLTGLTVSGITNGSTIRAALFGNTGAIFSGALVDAIFVNGSLNGTLGSAGGNSAIVSTLSATGTATVNSLTSNGNIVVSGTEVIHANGYIATTQLQDSGVSSGTYGNASAVPVLTIDSKGRITVANTAAVSGVSNVAYDPDSGNLTISTSSGSDFVVDIGTGRSDEPIFTNLTVTNTTTTNQLVSNTSVTAQNFIGNGGLLTNISGANVSTVPTATTAQYVTNLTSSNVTTALGYTPISNTATYTAISTNVSTLNSTITTANSNMKTYVDSTVSLANTQMGEYITTYYASLSTVNAAIASNLLVATNYTNTSNGAMKVYVDGAISTVNANIVTANNGVVTYVDTQVSTANTNMKSYVDGEITTTQGQIVTANNAVVDYINTQIDSVNSNATTANSEVVTYINTQIDSVNSKCYYC